MKEGDGGRQGGKETGREERREGKREGGNGTVTELLIALSSNFSSIRTPSPYFK